MRLPAVGSEELIGSDGPRWELAKSSKNSSLRRAKPGFC
jgi:hypothetical protein